MIERLAAVSTTVAAIGCGITAGVLLAFSVSVMPALRSQPPASAASSMQQMNVAIVSPVFMTVFLGSAAAATVAAVTTWMSHGDAAITVTVGAALFVIGCFLVTIVVNVPLNDALAVADPQTDGGLETWSTYLTRWTRWNHARTVAAIAACAALTVAVRR
ncbi:anthrone oxygenase family protein [Rhodococcoides kyotonense]|nr:anthrone oxygenase family protein [Rhodococcus kyotonensis]